MYNVMLTSYFRSVKCDKLFLENGGNNMIMSKEEQLLNCKWENKIACKKCGGKCCQRTACEASPYDFDCDRTKMAAALATGNYSIDLIPDKGRRVFKTLGSMWTLDVDFLMHSHETTFFMRPRNQGQLIVDIIHIGNELSPCVFWSRANGCRLPYEERPKYGRGIIPVAPGICENVFDTHTMLLSEWHPYKEFMYQTLKKYFDQDWYRPLGFTIR